AKESIAIALVIAPLAGLTSLVLGTWMDLLLRSAFWRLNAGAPTIILGTGVKSRFLAQLLSKDRTMGLRPVGFIADRQEESFDRAGDESIAHFPVLNVSGADFPLFEAPEVLVVPDSRALFHNEVALNRWGFRKILLADRLDEVPCFGPQMGQVHL